MLSELEHVVDPATLMLTCTNYLQNMSLDSVTSRSPATVVPKLAERKKFPIMKIPMEILDIVLEYCDAQSLASLQTTCRAMRCVLRPTLWNEVRIEFDGRGKHRSATCLAPPELNYRHKSPWYMSIDAAHVDEFCEIIKQEPELLFWTRHLMIKSPVHTDLEELRVGNAQWIMANITEQIPALDSLDIWGLTPDWYPHFRPLFDKYNSSMKSLHWITPAVSDCVMINNLKAMSVHDELLENLCYAFDLEEFNFYAQVEQDTESLENSLVSCALLKRLSLHIPGIVGEAREWMPTYVEEYEQYFDNEFGGVGCKQHEGLKFMRTTIPSGRLTQDFEFPGLERLSIYSGGAVKVCPDLFDRWQSIRELVLEDIPLSLIIDQSLALTSLQSLICRGGIFDGMRDSPRTLPSQLKFLIVKPNQRDSLQELTQCTAKYLADSSNLRIFIDSLEPIHHPEWRWVKGSVVSDGFAHYVGSILYEHVF